MSRRANGEGTIYRRSDGRWTARLSLSSGKRKDFYGRSRQEVAKRLDAARRAQDEGLPVDLPERLTLEAYLSRWLESRARPTVRQSTYVSYEVQVRRHIVPAIGKVALTRLSPPLLQSFYAERLKAGLSPRSVLYIHKVLHRALSAAVKWGLVTRNACDLVEPPRVGRPKLHAFNADQARAFLDATADDRLSALYLTALCTGLRRGELLALRWEDIDLERGTLAVRNALVKVRGGWQLAETKTPSSRRVVKLPLVAAEALRRHRSQQLQEKLAAGPAWHDSAHVFASRAGTPLDGDNLHRAFKKHLSSAGLPSMPFHSLRHSAATLMLALGVQPKVVAEMLGHSRIGVTMDTYSHVLPHLQDEAAAKMDALLAAR
jgi:integrase